LTVEDIVDGMMTVLQPYLTKIDELWRIAGLDLAASMTVTPTSRIAGAIRLKLTGDGVTSTTVERQ
jgi:hypothetical protein